MLTTNECNKAIDEKASKITTTFEVKTENYNNEVIELRQRVHGFKVVHRLTDDEIQEIQDEIDDIDSDLEFEAVIPMPIWFTIKSENNITSNVPENENNNVEDADENPEYQAEIY